AATGIFDLLLGDAGPAVVGDEITGATIEQAMLAVTELGRLHGRYSVMRHWPKRRGSTATRR
ncbi:hypothetical protein, partial [Mycobacterium szulgai]|uniref:hypothetical protein n=1 Tax=Mycobacterium szulgai TaxID=1787 RepID=UPI0035575E90